jgi:hypothetical protein
MAKVGRNERCPCGSGRKVKRCCGTEGVRERLERAAEAVEEAFTLPAHFPCLRARGADLDAWTVGAAARALQDAVVREGLALLTQGERERIVRECEEGQATAWRNLVHGIGDASLAADALLAGAVVAAVVERLPPPAPRLSFLDFDTPLDDAAEALAFVVRPEDLWSLAETAHLDRELVRLDEELGEEAFERAWDGAIAAFSRRLWSEWHDDRLAELVARARALLPYDGYPKASAAVAAACDAFERDAGVRDRLASLLLEGSLGRIDAAYEAAEPLAEAA